MTMEMFISGVLIDGNAPRVSRVLRRAALEFAVVTPNAAPDIGVPVVVCYQASDVVDVARTTGGPHFSMNNHVVYSIVVGGIPAEAIVVGLGITWSTKYIVDGGETIRLRRVI
ncbi:MAG: hypothetical protein ACRDZ7_03920 [Acidimicrobiia bacterium]